MLRPGEGAEGRAAARPLRPRAQAGEGGRRDRRARSTTGARTWSSTSTSRSSAAGSTRRSSCASSASTSAAAAAAGRRWRRRGKNPDGVGDALAAGKQAVADALAVKVLALDYGSARTGVAVSDPTGTLARPVGVVEQAGPTPGSTRLRRARRARGAERIVVGMPADAARRARRAGARRPTVRRGAARARATFRSRRFDERFTRRSSPDRVDDAKAAAHLLVELSRVVERRPPVRRAPAPADAGAARSRAGSARSSCSSARSASASGWHVRARSAATRSSRRPPTRRTAEAAPDRLPGGLHPRADGRPDHGGRRDRADEAARRPEAVGAART